MATTSRAARPGTAVAHDEGLVVIAETAIDDALRAEGDARELTRAVQDLRKQAGLDFDEPIDLWLDAPAALLAPIDPYLAALADDTIADSVDRAPLPAGAVLARHQVSGGEVALGLRGKGGSSHD